MTPEQVQFNKEFNAMRTSVEWAFGKVVKYFAYVDFKPSMKLQRFRLARYTKWPLFSPIVIHACTEQV